MMNGEMTHAQLSKDLLLKLVGSAELLLKRLRKMLPEKERSLVDQWLCFRQDYDNTCTPTCTPYAASNSYHLSPIDEVSESEVQSVTSAKSLISSACTEDGIVRELESCDDKLSDSMAEASLDFEENIDEYMAEFQMYTNAAIFDWISHYQFSPANESLATADAETNTKNSKSSRGNKSLNITNRQQISKRRYKCKPKGTRVTHNKDNTKILQANVNNLRISESNLNHRASMYPLNTFTTRNDYYKIIGEINQLRNVKVILSQSKLDIVNQLHGRELENSPQYRNYIKLDIAIEIIDIAIELKNRINLGQDISKDHAFFDKIERAISECVNMQSLDEMRQVLIFFLKKVVEIRESGARLDKELCKQDRFISKQQSVIKDLTEKVCKIKLIHKSEFMIMQKRFEEKLQLQKIEASDGPNSNVDSVSDENHGAQDIVSFLPKGNVQYTLQSKLKHIKGKPSVSTFPSSIPNKSLKNLQGTSSSTKFVNVTRQKNKLIIQRQNNDNT